MLTTAKICALLLGGVTLGVTGTVAVQKQNSPKREVGRPAAAKGKPGVSLSGASGARSGQPRQPPASPPRILDCPTPAPSLGPGVWASPAAPGLPPVTGAAPRLPMPPVQPGGGGGFVPSPPTSPPAVPEPAAWAMLITGFGLVGASLRRKEPARG